MPASLRAGFYLSVLLFLLVAFAPPSARVFSLLNQETLPRIKRAENARALQKGMPNRLWTMNFLPAEMMNAANTAPAASSAGKPGEETWKRPLYVLGLRWFYLTGLYSGIVMLFIFALIAYGFAFLAARRLASPWRSLAVSLALAALFYFADPVTRLAIPADFRALAERWVSTGQLTRQIWAGPLCVFAAALFASFLPFPRVDPPPSMYPRFIALLRDTSFLFLALMLATVPALVASLGPMMDAVNQSVNAAGNGGAVNIPQATGGSSGAVIALVSLLSLALWAYAAYDAYAVAKRAYRG